MKGDIKMGLENLQYPVEEDFYKLETWNTNTKILADAVTASNTEIANSKNMIGDLSSLSTNDKTSTVLAINELFNKISNDTTGFVNVKSMETTTLKVDMIAKNHAETNGATNILRNPIWIENNVSCKEVYPTLVQASNDLKVGSNISLKTLSNYVGTMSSLSTSEKSSLVGAINEIYDKAKSSFSYIGSEGSDLNNINVTGLYSINPTAINSPVNTYGLLLCFSTGSWNLQIYRSTYDEERLHYRLKINNEDWTNWKTICEATNDVKTVGVDISSVGTGCIEYNIVNGICHVMINDFTPTMSYSSWYNVCDLPKDKYGNDYTISCDAINNDTSSNACAHFRFNHNLNKLQVITNFRGTFYGTLSYPVAD